MTDGSLKETMAECTGFNGRGLGLEGFDELVDKLVRHRKDGMTLYLKRYIYVCVCVCVCVCVLLCVCMSVGACMMIRR